MKFNALNIIASCDGVINYSNSYSSSKYLIIFIVSLVVGIICVVVIQKDVKEYKQNKFKKRYKKLQDTYEILNKN